MPSKVQVGNKVYMIDNVKGTAKLIKTIPFKKKKFKKKDGAWRTS